MNPGDARVAKTSQGKDHHNTLTPLGPCFIYLQVHEDLVEDVIVGEPYTLRGKQRGKVYGGVTDDEGILRHEGIPDDYYELEIQGNTEPVEVWYMAELDIHEGKPWVLRIRSNA